MHITSNPCEFFLKSGGSERFMQATCCSFRKTNFNLNSRAHYPHVLQAIDSTHLLLKSIQHHNGLTTLCRNVDL